MRASFPWIRVAVMVLAVLPGRAAETPPRPEDSEPNQVAARHWSFQPVLRPAVPGIRNPGRARNPIDHFIIARLAEHGLGLAPEADRRTLIRRLAFDLLGLPPTPEEVAAFNTDRDSGAYERLVERFLASPRHGERWARHWLDAVRFAESHGFEMNQARPNAWPYRDYVIDTFNANTRYDRFILEQLAGDMFGQDAATAFLVGGPWDQVKSPDPVLTAQQRADELHDMVSTTASTFLGLTVGCARCHDHKFDPIPQTDYYAFKACFEGVQHGDRDLRPANDGIRQAQIAGLRAALEPLLARIKAFEPKARLGRTLILDNDPPATGTNGPTTLELAKPKGIAAHAAGHGRGQAADPGSTDRLPNLGRSYHWWEGLTKRNLFAWQPRLEGRYRLWLSWGCGWNTHATDARYLLDRDGDPATAADQIEIARVDQRQFAEGSGNKPGDLPNQPLWSGFYLAGDYDLARSSCLLLRSGATGAPVTADAVLFEEVLAGDEPGAAAALPHLRVPVNRGENSESFEPVAVRYVRFRIFETTQLEPCLDELEVFTGEPQPRNVALAAAGAKASASSTLPGYDIHKLEHINDGRYGNDWSWISNERGGGWIQIELPRIEQIARVVWSRDRDKVPRYEDRTATKYAVEISLDGQSWRRVASADDRLPHGYPHKPPAIRTVRGLSGAERDQLERLLTRRDELEQEIRTLSALPRIYAGQFQDPGPTRRFYRGDPTKPREEIGPGPLTEVTFRRGDGDRAEAEGLLHFPAAEAERRLALARWIVHRANPLTARVLVNRLWHYHFGRGLVATPSDFGVNGAKPSHPELLDWLAAEFIDSGWDLKALHRLMITSATYRQGGLARVSSKSAALEAARLDAGNRWLWHFTSRRLEAEALRDTILFVSGKLDLKMGGPGFDLFEPNNNYVKVYHSKAEPGPDTWRRMIYQSKPRMQLDDVFGAFDCPDAGQIVPRRTSSTTPLQALNLLNSPFLVQHAGWLAQRLKREGGPNPREQLALAYHLLFGREPVPEETGAGKALIQAHGLEAFCRALFNANEFVYVY